MAENTMICIANFETKCLKTRRIPEECVAPSLSLVAETFYLRKV